MLMLGTHQLTQVIRDVILIPNNLSANFTTDLITGISIAILVALVVLGGIKRIGKVTGSMVPIMVVVYILAVLFIIFSNTDAIIPSLKLIISDAFTAQSVLGGSLGAIIITGVRRAAFSNEAGMGTAPMAHGAAKTNEPIREGLVAMLGPIIDTLIICTMTALAIIITGVWKTSDADGITLTAQAFEIAMPGFGQYLLTICVCFFSLSTMFAFPYYGSKCLSFVAGAHRQHYYHYLVVVLVVVGAVSQMHVVISFFDFAFAVMAFPTMISALLLSGKVRDAAKDYFKRLKT